MGSGEVLLRGFGWHNCRAKRTSNVAIDKHVLDNWLRAPVEVTRIAATTSY